MPFISIPIYIHLCPSLSISIDIYISIYIYLSIYMCYIYLYIYICVIYIYHITLSSIYINLHSSSIHLLFFIFCRIAEAILKESPSSDASTPPWSERTKFFPPPREGGETMGNHGKPWEMGNLMVMKIRIAKTDCVVRCYWYC